MPYTINMHRHTFLLNQRTHRILEAFKSACDQFYKSEDKETKLNADLSICDKQLRKGFIPKLLNTIENINEKKYGASYVTLNAINNVALDPKADKILFDYTTEINNLFFKNKFTSEELNQTEEVYSAALVFRILLLRLITIALCDDNTYVRDGEVLLNIYTAFIDKVLFSLNLFDKEKEIFRYFSTKEHLDWMHAIQQVVSAVKLIHSHQDNLTECLTTLKSITYSIQRMIFAYLVIANSQCAWPIMAKMSGAPKVSGTDLEDQFIDDKLNEYETYLGKKNLVKEESNITDITRSIGITTFAAIEHLGHKQKAKSILDVTDICENSQIAALVAYKNNHCPEPIYKKLEALYALYFKSRCLLISLEQIDDLITTCSWVPLVMGVINLAPICNLIRVHSEMCGNLLSIPNNDRINKLPFNQIIMQKCFHAQSQLTEMKSRLNALEELQNPIKIDKIKWHITHNINNLKQIQSALEICLIQTEKPDEKPKPKPDPIKMLPAPTNTTTQRFFPIPPPKVRVPEPQVISNRHLKWGQF